MEQLTACVCVPSVHESQLQMKRFKLFEQLLKVILFIVFFSEDTAKM